MLLCADAPERRASSSGPITLIDSSSGSPLTLIRLFDPSTKRPLCKRKNSFTILFTLLRTTATPVFLRMVTANRLISHPLAAAKRTKCAVSEHRVHCTPRKSPFLSLSCFVKVRVIRYKLSGFRVISRRISFHVFKGRQTARLFRPFARLRLITSRPEAVLMRTRNPCVLFLLLLCG